MSRNLHKALESFKPSMDAYHAHAHLLAKIAVVLRMSKTGTCSTKGVRVGQKALSESTLFVDIFSCCMGLTFLVFRFANQNFKKNEW